MHHNKLAGTLLIGVAILVVVMVGCSRQNPVSPMLGANGVSRANAAVTDGHEFNVVGQVATIDTAARKLTLVGDSIPISIDTSAKIFQKVKDSVTKISIGGIAVNDTIEASGFVMTGGTRVAEFVMVFIGQGGGDQGGGGGGGEGQEIRLFGKVLTVDTTLRSLTITGYNFPINLSPNARLFKEGMDDGQAIRLSDITPGDTVEVNGTLQKDSSVIAEEITVLSRNGEGFHSEFKGVGVISSIDSAGGTFMLAGDSDLIKTDSLTLFFTKEGSGRQREHTGASGGDDSSGGQQDSLVAKLTFADLKVGDTVSVFGDRIDATTVYAVAVEIGAAELGRGDHGGEHVAILNRSRVSLSR